MRDETVCVRYNLLISWWGRLGTPVVLLGLLVGALAACAAPTGPPSPTPTPVDAHVWEAEAVVIQFATLREDLAPYGFSRPPDLVLYADGRLVRNTAEGLRAQRLDREEICRLLNTLDQGGFFEVEMTSYDEMIAQQGFGLVSTTRIRVAAWKARAVRAEALAEVIDEPDLDVPAPLRDTYTLLRTYHPAGLRPYAFDRLALSLYRYPEDASQTPEMTWPLDEPSLASLLAQAEASGVKNRERGWGLVLEGEVAAEVYALLDEGKLTYIAEDGVLYAVAARPLLPYESLESAVGYQARIPSLEIPSALPIMRCYPSDGVLDVGD